MPTYNPNGTISITPGDTLSQIYGNNWRQLSGYQGDPRQLQVGATLPAPNQQAMAPNTNNTRGPIISPPSPIRATTTSITPGQTNYTMASVNSNQTPPGVGNTDLWNQVIKGAQQAQEKYGIPASVTISQFIQETGWGKHFVGNNLFGIKGSGPQGATKALTWEQGPNGPVQTYSNFKNYKNVQESIDDHARLLAENPAYKNVQNLIAAGETNPDKYAEALHGVYATDPRYGANLKSLTRQHNLVQYDNQNKTMKPSVNLASGQAPKIQSEMATQNPQQQFPYAVTASMTPTPQQSPTFNQNYALNQQQNGQQDYQGLVTPQPKEYRDELGLGVPVNAA